MNKNFYCTYFDQNFCPFGLSLLESITKHDSTSFIFVLCLDDDIFLLLKNLSLNNVQLLKILDLEKAFPELLKAKANRSTTEYYWTLTPYLLFYLIFRNKSCSTLTYLDADQFFYSDPKIIFDEIGSADVAIMPHRFPDLINTAKEHGEFNVSWVTFRNTPNAQKCLFWWKESCLEWCYAAGVEGKYGDQMYLDKFPINFKNVHIIQNLGCGVAPWNVISFDFGNRLILFHFESFRIRSSIFLTAVIPQFEKCDLTNFKQIVLLPYFKSLNKNSSLNPNKSINSSDKSLKLTNSTILFIFFADYIFFVRNKFLKMVFNLFIPKGL